MGILQVEKCTCVEGFPGERTVFASGRAVKGPLSIYTSLPKKRQLLFLGVGNSPGGPREPVQDPEVTFPEQMSIFGVRKVGCHPVHEYLWDQASWERLAPLPAGLPFHSALQFAVQRLPLGHPQGTVHGSPFSFHPKSN
jgi:hypothetical protein